MPHVADGRLGSPGMPSSSMASPISRPGKRKAGSTAGEVPPTAQALAKVRVVSDGFGEISRSIFEQHFHMVSAFACLLYISASRLLISLHIAHMFRRPSGERESPARAARPPRYCSRSASHHRKHAFSKQSTREAPGDPKERRRWWISREEVCVAD